MSDRLDLRSCFRALPVPLPEASLVAPGPFFLQEPNIRQALCNLGGVIQNARAVVSYSYRSHERPSHMLGVPMLSAAASLYKLGVDTG